MINPIKAAKLVQNIGIDPKFLASLSLLEGREYIKSYTRNLQSIFHPDRRISKDDSKFKDIGNLIEIINDIGYDQICFSLKDLKKEKVDNNKIDYKEKNIFLEKIAYDYIFGNYNHKLMKKAGNSYLLINSPNVFFGAEPITINTIKKNEKLKEKLDKHNQILKNEKINELEEKINDFNDKEKIYKNDEVYYKERIEEINKFINFLSNNSLDNIKNYLVDSYSKLREEIRKESENDAKNLERNINLIMNKSEINSNYFDYNLSKTLKDKVSDMKRLIAKLYNHPKEKLVEELMASSGIILKKNENRLRGLENDLGVLKNKRNILIKEIDNLTNDFSEILINERNPRKMFKFYYSNSDLYYKKYILAGNFKDDFIEPMVLLYFDENGFISYLNFDGDKISQKKFNKTNRKIIGILGSQYVVDKYFNSSLDEKPKILLMGNGNEKDEILSIDTIIKSKSYELMQENPSKNSIILSIDNSSENPVYRIEGIVASNFFKDLFNPRVYDNYDSKVYLKILKDKI